MKASRSVVIVLAALFLAVLALCVLTAYGAYRWAKDNSVALGSTYVQDAKVSETRTFSAPEGLDLALETGLGSVTVEAVEGLTGAEVEIERHAWGASEEEARQKAEAVQVQINEEAGSLSLKYEIEEPVGINLGELRPPRVSFYVKIPSKIDAVITTGNGSVTLSGVQGSVEINSMFGDIEVSDVKGSLKVNGANALLTARKIEAGSGDIRLETTFGGVEAEDLSGAKLIVNCGNGSVHLSQVNMTGEMRVDNTFSSVLLEQVQADSLSINNQNGSVTVTGGQVGGALEIHNNFGRQEIKDVTAARYELENQNGPILLNGASGEISASTTFGEITVENAREAVLKLNSQNGAISFSGSLAEGKNHSLETTFGDVLLRIPATTALNVEFEATFGKIRSDLPVTLTGEMSDERWTGKLNNGGSLLSVSVTNGSIVVREAK